MRLLKQHSNGLILLLTIIEKNTKFNQFDKAMKTVRKAMKSGDVQVRGLSIAVLREMVIRYTKIDEIKEEALRITHAAIKSRHAQEQYEGFALYCALIGRDKEFNQFDELTQNIDLAMQSSDKDVQASGIWLLYKHVKRNPHFDAFKKAHAIAKIGMESSSRGMRCSTSALLSILVRKEARFSELPEVQRFAIAEVRSAMATKVTTEEWQTPASFTNSVSLLSQLVDRDIDFQKHEYASIQQAALRGVEIAHAKAWANALGMLVRLVDRRMATLSIDQLTTIALQAMKSKMPRVLTGGLHLLRIILQQEATFVQFEAAEQATLRCTEYDNTWVRRQALDVLIELLQKNKLQNLTLAEHVAQRSAHSSNDEEHRAGKELLHLLMRKKNHNVFVFGFLALAFFGLCYFLGSWLLRKIRNRRLRMMSKFGHKDWSKHDPS